MMLFHDQSGNAIGDGLGTCVYQQRREPVLVCPYCKRAVQELVTTKDGKPFDVFRCREHGDVVAILSEVVNKY